jgi:hypothetical protein
MRREAGAPEGMRPGELTLPPTRCIMLYEFLTEAAA